MHLRDRLELAIVPCAGEGLTTWSSRIATEVKYLIQLIIDEW